MGGRCENGVRRRNPRKLRYGGPEAGGVNRGCGARIFKSHTTRGLPVLDWRRQRVSSEIGMGDYNKFCKWLIPDH